jgi:UDP-N-acetylglucosamine:LPS N-acetylglucosamine transferase
MKRVLIFIGDAGGGHLSAAKAVTETFQTLYGDEYTVKTLDIFTEAGIKPFKDSAQTYARISSSLLLEFIYNLVVFIGSTGFGYYLYRTYVNAKLYRATKKIVEAYAPDILIANNSIITPLIGKMKKEGAPFIVAGLVTDIVNIFRGWADREVDCIISPTHEATKKLLHYGVDPERILEPLFPINPRLASFRPRTDVLRELGFDASLKTILVTAGGVGIASLEHALDDLVADPGLQVIILAGRVEEQCRELTERYAGNQRVKVLGFISNVQDYYNAVDIVVGKPGPATILEVELFGKKAVLTKRVGVQENGNASFALHNPNFRSIGGRWHKLKRTVDELLASETVPFPGRRSFDECERIVKEIVALLDKKKAGGQEVWQ